MKSAPERLRFAGNTGHAGLSGLRARLRRLLCSDRGSVTVEFVIIVPVMLLLMLGFTEIYMYSRAVSVVEHTAFTLADSIGQMNRVIDDNSSVATPNSLAAIWNAAALLAAPSDLQAKGGVYVTSVCDQTTKPCGAVPATPQSMAAGTPRIWWQRSAPWTDGNMRSLVTANNILPAAWPFRNGDSAVIVEVFYQYTPFSMTAPFWASAPGTQTIYQRVYVRPRYTPTLELDSAS
ncbi:Flp pilus assembly protein TadG [Paraburkholderia sp. BL8N3]|jgi:Flp pilus assembly protein TadG|nr:TadE/TadG family type IV pilus assembly protein [Paraburkholderia sp. BL8N3]TCK38748.1 Flp pilus assembly protein TadG [Paraburkholderia sp. BL8N3]